MGYGFRLYGFIQWFRNGQKIYGVMTMAVRPDGFVSAPCNIGIFIMTIDLRIEKAFILGDE